MAPKKPDPPSAPPEETRKETTPMTVPPEKPAPSPPPDASTQSNPATDTATSTRKASNGSTNSRNTSWTSGLTKGIRQLEIWHQKMGHPAPTVLQRTQKCVKGIPKIPDAAPIFHCRFCDQAKQHKVARGKPESNDAYLPGTMFHMDLRFFRGPSNLEDVVHNGAQPSDTTIIKSIDGHVAYLSIVDAATRMLWTFP